MKKQSSKSVFIISSLLVMAILSSCNSSSSKDAKNKVYTSNGIGTSGTGSSELYGGNLSNFKGRAGSDGDNASSGIKIPRSVSAPTAAIKQVDVDNLPQRQVSRASINGVNAYNQTQSKTFKSSNVDIFALQQNAPNSDINSTLKVRTTETSTTASVGTKGKTGEPNKKGPQKGGPAKPAEPGIGSLPIGEGTWLLLLMVGTYASVFNIKPKYKIFKVNK